MTSSSSIMTTTTCRGMLRQLRSLRVEDVVVKVERLLAHLLHALHVLVENVLAHKLRPHELLVGEGTEPLALAQLLGVLL